MSRFLDFEDNSNIEFMASLLLFDYIELANEEVTAGLYNSLYQFHPTAVVPPLQQPDLQQLPGNDEFITFMVECFARNEFCFEELRPFSVVALNNVSLFWL